MAQETFRFLHASDFHLDQPPGGLTDLPSELVEPLIESTYRAVDAVFDAAIRERVAFVVLSGDLIHFPTASPRAIDFLSAQFERLREKKIPVYWLGGQLEAGHAIPDDFKLPKNVHRMATTRVEKIEVKRDRETIAYVVGQSGGETPLPALMRCVFRATVVSSLACGTARATKIWIATNWTNLESTIGHLEECTNEGRLRI